MADFSTNRRVLLLSALALPIGTLGAVVAKALLWLIAVFTNAAFFLRFSSEPVNLQGHHFGWWGVMVPAIGGLIIGLMARYGSEKIRGHGIPEALEGWLLGQMIAWFGIAYYLLTDDARWFVAGLVLFLLSFVVFPITQAPSDRC